MSNPGFQQTVSLATGQGVPGDLYNDYPKRSQSFILVSALASYNNIGSTMYTISAQGIAQAGTNGGTNFGIAGLLINPKVYALQGDGSRTLNPSLNLPNQTQAELLTEGSVYVTLPNTANIGDIVIFDNVTGAISSITPTTSLPSGKSYANAFIDVYTVTAAGLAIATFNPAPVNVS